MGNGASKVNILPAEMGSLSNGLPPAQPDTLFVRGSNGGVSVAPDIHFPLFFGRDQQQVHVSVGGEDTYVSRRHGVITRDRGWMVTNIGKLPLRLPGSRLVLGGDCAEIPSGYTPMFIVSAHQEHLLEVRIATRTPVAADVGECDATTRNRQLWVLSPVERLVVTCLAQRYLRNDPQAQPLSWAEVAVELTEHSDEEWNWRRAARVIAALRTRLSPKVPGLREEEVPPPIGNTLNHNLIMELLITTTLTKTDLDVFDGGPVPSGGSVS